MAKVWCRFCGAEDPDVAAWQHAIYWESGGAVFRVTNAGLIEFDYVEAYDSEWSASHGPPGFRCRECDKEVEDDLDLLLTSSFEDVRLIRIEAGYDDEEGEPDEAEFAWEKRPQEEIWELPIGTVITWDGDNPAPHRQWRITDFDKERNRVYVVELKSGSKNVGHVAHGGYYWMRVEQHAQKELVVSIDKIEFTEV